MNFFYDFFNLFFKWLRINRDLQENLGETPRCRRGASCAGGDGVGAVGEKLGGTGRNSEGLRFREREGGNLVVMEVWELCGRIGN